jgi:hydrogenase expression/formation protein HypE
MPTAKSLPVGKLPPNLLQKLLQSSPIPKSSGVVLGPKYGEDAAVLDIGGKCLIAKTDPITFTADRIGWYAVNVNANDIAALGGRPRWFLATFLFPEGKATAADVQRVVRETRRACEALGVILCGGHTEITAGLARPLVVGQMLGEVDKSKLVRKDRQRPGDLVVLTKGIAIEGTAILAREKAALLRKKLGTTMVRRAQRLLLRPGISVVRDAQLALRYGEVRAMHDPTEGGLAAALVELARAGNVGLEVWKANIPVLPETQAVAKALNADPLSLLASGALLMVSRQRSVEKLLRGLRRGGIAAEVIGEVRNPKEGIMIVDGGHKRPLRVPRCDEIARLLAQTS